MNQEQELREIRNRWDVDDFVIDDKGQSDILTLLEAIDQRDAIIHDLQLDGSALARRAVEEFAAGLWDWVNAERQRHQMTNDFDTGAACALGVVQARIDELRASGTAPDPLPPDQARAECERLRAKLRKIREQIGTYLDVYAHYQEQWPGLEPVMKTLIRMASEDTP